MARTRRMLRNRRGATLAVVAVSMIGLLAIMALAIDMGMMYSARNEAQRVADSAALAGASAFIETPPPPSYTAEATLRANDYISRNSVMGAQADTSIATVTVNTATKRVRVTVRRQQISTWFARVFGVNTVAVTATATAEASDAGSATCVRPWAVQDMWFESATGQRPTATDLYEPAAGDTYIPAAYAGDASATGYGRADTDNGAQIVMKSQRPGQNALAQPGPGEFMIWDMPDDPDLEKCTPQAGNNPSAPPYQYVNSICGCNKNPVNLGQEYPLNPGNVVGPSRFGYEALIAKDPSARWDASTGTVISSQGMSSPRIVTIALIAPLAPPPGQNWTQANFNTVTFTNFAYLFVEDYTEVNLGQGVKVDQITGRFLYYVNGGAGGNTTGPLAKILRLVE